ncbi:MAG: hypothetical protein HYR51_18520 [Candidatus Rokubacteria bacterium]|nr:hypothetical protein [Candidatus Rokubacteria bacterium]
MAKVIDWDGTHLPDGLRELPPGQYVIEPVEDRIELSEQEEEELRTALDALDAGHGIPLADVIRQIGNRPPSA